MVCGRAPVCGLCRHLSGPACLARLEFVLCKKKQRRSFSIFETLFRCFGGKTCLPVAPCPVFARRLRLVHSVVFRSCSHAALSLEGLELFTERGAARVSAALAHT